MSDAMLREIERRARSGDHQAEAAHLLARVRAGTLTPDRIGLAAYCSHPAADLAVETFGEAWRYDLIRRRFGLDGWLVGLKRWGPAVLVRASVAAGEEAYAVPGAVRHTEDGLPDPALQVLVAARRWLSIPDHAHEVVWRVVSGGDGVPLWAPTVWTQALHNPHGPPAWSRGAADCVTQAALTAGADSVRKAIESALVAWALGNSP